MDVYNINLNIHYSAPQQIWDKLEQLYKEMPGWNGFKEGCPQWKGRETGFIEASAESSGLQFYVKLPAEEWDEWIHRFTEKASGLLGYEIGEPEDGYAFYYWD